jgi:hypothetical protein
MKIPTRNEHRGMALHAGQNEARLIIVRQDIDRVFEERDIAALAQFAGKVAHSPESRLLAAAKAQALWDSAAEQRTKRPDLNLERIATSVAGLNVIEWQDPTFYCSLLDTWSPDAPPARRETPLDSDTADG